MSYIKLPYASGYIALGAFRSQEGTAARLQFTITTNFASRYHSGAWCRSIEFQVGFHRPLALTTSISVSSSAARLIMSSENLFLRSSAEYSYRNGFGSALLAGC